MSENQTETPMPQVSVPHFTKLRGDKCNWLVPPSIQYHMTAVKYAQQTRDGTITLFYTDGTTEKRKTDRDMVREFDGFLSLVSYVQAQRAAV